MKLSELLEGIEHQIPEGLECEVQSVTADTRQIGAGSLFVCLRGTVNDGHDFAEKALRLGAVAVVCDHDLGLAKQVLSPDTHLAFALICANFFGNPQREMKMIGVTGTNGKTTITHMIKEMIEHFGHKTGLIGTIDNQIGEMRFPAKYTTPDPLTFYTTLARMRDAGCEYVVMEVSSHGLAQQRVAGCSFDAAVFTNLTQDHLDYHKTMENYYQAKKRLFTMCKKAVINLDDEYGQRLAKECECEVLTFSIRQDAADYTAKSIALRPHESTFAFVGNSVIARAKVPIPGEFSISNAMASIVTGLALSFPLEEVIGCIADTKGIPGRFEILKTDTPFTIIRDYAHTPDALEKVLSTLRATVKEGRIIALFGCAGNRDPAKRKEMPEIAARLADFVILTSDNPRSEDPTKIIEDSKPGLLKHRTPYRVIVDRYQAIRWALENAQPGDTLLLAGKGHEDYQVLAHGTIHFDEKEIVEELLAEIRKEQAAEKAEG